MQHTKGPPLSLWWKQLKLNKNENNADPLITNVMSEWLLLSLIVTDFGQICSI